MANLILTRPNRGGGGSGGIANAFETIVTDSGSVVAVSNDTLVLIGGNAIDTSAIGGSPQSIAIDVDPTKIFIGELGDVSIGSPTPLGYVLGWDGTEWVPTDPASAAAGIIAGPGITVATTGSPSSSIISLDICSVPDGAGSPSTLSLDDYIAVCDGALTTKYTLADLAVIFPFAVTAWTTINGDTGTITADTEDADLTIIGGVAVNTTAASGSPDTLTIDVDASQINIEDLGNVSILGSPPVPSDGDVLTYQSASPAGWINKPATSPTPGDLELTIINGQPMITFLDTTRGSPGKRLSVAEQALTFSENRLIADDWIQVGNATDADTGFIVDFDGTVTFATGQCENTGTNSKAIHLFVNGVDNGSVGTLSGGVDVSFINTTLDIDFSQGDKIRLQAQQGAGGAIEDTVIKITVKWRA